MGGQGYSGGKERKPHHCERGREVLRKVCHMDGERVSVGGVRNGSLLGSHRPGALVKTLPHSGPQFPHLKKEMVSWWYGLDYVPAPIYMWKSYPPRSSECDHIWGQDLNRGNSLK